MESWNLQSNFSKEEHEQEEGGAALYSEVQIALPNSNLVWVGPDYFSSMDP